MAESDDKALSVIGAGKIIPSKPSTIYAVDDMKPLTLDDVVGNPQAVKALMLGHKNLADQVESLEIQLVVSKLQTEQLMASKSTAVTAAALGVGGSISTGVGFYLMTLPLPVPHFGWLLVVVGALSMLLGNTATAWLPRWFSKK